MKTFIDKLAKLADGLDSLGLKKDADVLDQIIAKAAAGDEFGDYLNLFDQPLELDMEEEKGPGGEKLVIEEPMMEATEEDETPLSKEKTGPSRLDLLKRRHDLLKIKKKLEHVEKMEAEEDDMPSLDEVKLPVATPEDLSFEDEEDDDLAAANEADDGLIDELKSRLKSAPELAMKVLQIVKDNPELLELLAL